MKKLLAKILMVSIAMPVLANPIKLSCTVTPSGGGDAQKFLAGFDEVAGTVLWGGVDWHKVTDKCTATEDFICF